MPVTEEWRQELMNRRYRMLPNEYPEEAAKLAADDAEAEKAADEKAKSAAPPPPPIDETGANVVPSASDASMKGIDVVDESTDKSKDEFKFK